MQVHTAYISFSIYTNKILLCVPIYSFKWSQFKSNFRKKFQNCILVWTVVTLQKYGAFLKGNTQEKCFKIFHIFAIWKPTHYFLQYSYRFFLWKINECPGLWWYRPGHSLFRHKTKLVARNEKPKTTYLGLPKIW